MEIVINIPESYYEGVLLDRILETTLDGILEAIKNGKVLPKHGRLIDADTLMQDYGNDDVKTLLDISPTILETNEE